MLKKIIQIFIFAGFWLCFVPWLVYCLHGNFLQPNGIWEYFIDYTTLLFILIIIYWLINRIVDHCYMKHKVKSKIQKITIKQQLERLERGEIDIVEAQDLKTFTKVQKPKSIKSKAAAGGQRATNKKARSMENLNEPKKIRKESSTSTKGKAPIAPVMPDLPPAYDDEMENMLEQ